MTALPVELLATLAGVVVLTLFLAGLVDIGRNGVRGNFTRASRHRNGAKDTGPVLFTALLTLSVVLVVSGAISITAKPDTGSPQLRLSTEPLTGLVDGGGR